MNVPADAVAGQKITAIASSGDEVIFTLPKGVSPGTRLQMIPTRQVMKRGTIIMNIIRSLFIFELLHLLPIIF